MSSLHPKKGFTLVELLIVMAIIIIIAGIILISINPVQRLAAARNAKRAGDVANIVNALWLKTYDDGQRITALDSDWRMLGKSTASDCDVICGDLSGGLMYHGLQTGETDFDHVGYSTGVNDVDLDLTSDWSVSFWMKQYNLSEITDNIAISPIFSEYSAIGTPLGYFLSTIEDDLFLYVSSTQEGVAPLTFVAEDVVKENEYMHVVVSYDRQGSSSVLRMFVDGQLVSENLVSDPDQYPLQSYSPFQIGGSRVLIIGPELVLIGFLISGGDWEGGSELAVIEGNFSFDGAIDDMRIYDQALDAPQAAALAQGMEPESPGTLLHHWKFDDDDLVNQTVDSVTGLNWLFRGQAEFTDDIPPLTMRLPPECVDVEDDVEGYLDTIPISPEANDYVPDADRTFYAARRDERGALEVRACLTEDDGDNKPFPGIKARK